MSKSICLSLEPALKQRLAKIAKDKSLKSQTLLKSKIDEWLMLPAFLSDEEDWRSTDKPTEKTGIQLRLEKTIFAKLKKIAKDLNFKNVPQLLRIKIGAWLAIPIFVDDGEYWSPERVKVTE